MGGGGGEIGGVDYRLEGGRGFWGGVGDFLIVGAMGA